MIKKENDKFVNSNVFEGMTSISALIKAISAGQNDRRIEKILFDEAKIKSKHAEFKFISYNAEALGYTVEVCSSDVIDTYTIGNSHGGIVAVCGDRIIQNLSIDKIKKDGIYYMLEGVEDPYNFGNAVRSLYAAGADGIIVGARNWMGAAGVVARSSAGASELIDMYQTQDCTDAVRIFRSCGYNIICAGIRYSVDLFEAELKKPLFIIIGGEKRGISRQVLDEADTIIRIGYGRQFNGSLSTSATAALFGFENNRKNRIL